MFDAEALVSATRSTKLPLLVTPSYVSVASGVSSADVANSEAPIVIAESNIRTVRSKARDDLFMNNLNSTLAVKREYELSEYDYEWLEMIEEVLPYLDNILRNPKRFINNR